MNSNLSDAVVPFCFYWKGGDFEQKESEMLLSMQEFCSASARKHSLRQASTQKESISYLFSFCKA